MRNSEREILILGSYQRYAVTAVKRNVFVTVFAFAECHCVKVENTVSEKHLDEAFCHRGVTLKHSVKNGFKPFFYGFVHFFIAVIAFVDGYSVFFGNAGLICYNTVGHVFLYGICILRKHRYVLFPLYRLFICFDNGCRV